jgi:hypothetical protein
MLIVDQFDGLSKQLAEAANDAKGQRQASNDTNPLGVYQVEATLTGRVNKATPVNKSHNHTIENITWSYNFFTNTVDGEIEILAYTDHLEELSKELDAVAHTAGTRMDVGISRPWLHQRAINFYKKHPAAARWLYNIVKGNRNAARKGQRVKEIAKEVPKATMHISDVSLANLNSVIDQVTSIISPQGSVTYEVHGFSYADMSNIYEDGL